MLNFTELDDVDYQELRYQFILDNEEGGDPAESLYLDGSDHNPTIGIGFNLRDENSRSAVLHAFGFDFSDADENQYITRIESIVGADYSDASTLQADLDQVMLDRSNDPAISGVKRATFTFNDDQEIKDVFSVVVQTHETDIDNWLSGIPESNERAVLVDLSYNGGGILDESTNLRQAIVDDNRADAWYEIRYNTNSGDQPADIRPGIANRRYRESDLFGLYNDESNVSEAEARNVIQMYTEHWGDKIKGYEEQFPPGSAGTDVVGIQSLMSPAETVLIDDYVTAASIPVTIASGEGRVLVGEDVADTTRLTGSGQSDLILGGGGDDVVHGGEGADVLYGEADDDRLDGGAGGDFLFGGAGVDTYLAADGDTLEDADGAGTVLFGDTLLVGATSDGSGNYVGADGEIYALSGSTLTVTKDTGSIVINDFTNGDMGINLTDNDGQPPANVITGTDFDDQDADDDTAHNALHGTTGDDTIYGLVGDDDLLGDAGNDFLYGDDGTDFLAGEDGDDSLFSGIGHDILRGGNGQDTLTAGDDAVALSGGSGDDTLLGGGGADYMTGGADSDTLTGGNGNDVIDGDDDGTPVVRDWSFSLVMGPPPYSITGTSFQVPRGIDAPAGQFVSSGHDDSQPPPVGDAADTLLGGGGSDLITGWGGNDTLAGGAGNDSLFGGWGDDVGDGGDGSDYLAGWKGNDLLMGGIDADVILAGSEDDELYGGEGVDLLAGDDLSDLSVSGKDYLDGGSEGDYLDGGPGSDILVGGAGNDSLLGNSGNDEYRISIGDGVDTLIDSGDVNSVKFGSGITYEDISARLVADQNGTIYLQVQYDPTEAVNIQNGHVGAVQNFEFADGSTVSYQQIMEDNGIAQASTLNFFGDESAGYSVLANPAIPVEAVDTIDGTGKAQPIQVPSSDQWTSMHRQLDRHLALGSSAALGSDWDEKRATVKSGV
jgi:Ca2+-binding RTX toxin-like protein